MKCLNHGPLTFRISNVNLGGHFIFLAAPPSLFILKLLFKFLEFIKREQIENYSSPSLLGLLISNMEHGA